ncbi:MAG: hypothetical protein WCV68_02280 [Candidatus Paceibacterota bacterium]
MNLRKIFVLALFLSLFVLPALTQAATTPNVPNPSWTAWGSCPAITSATACGNFLYRTRICTGTRCPSMRVQSKICGYAPCSLDQNKAEFVEITGAPSTSTLTPRQEFVLTVKVKNTSDIFWPKQSTANLAKKAYGYRLAFVDINADVNADGYSDYTNVWDYSYGLTLNQDIATGSIATFSKKIKAPSKAGTYTLTMQMYQQNRGLFGPKSETKTYTVGGGDTDILANPTLDSYGDWEIKTAMKKLSWDKKAFSSSYVEIWMCPSTVVIPSSDDCIKSYGGTDAVNSGSRDIGLPLGVTPGLWKVFVTGTTNGTVGSGFTPVVKLVDNSGIVSLGISGVDVGGTSFNEVSDIWTRGMSKAVDWVTTGDINHVKISICPVGLDTCLLAKHNDVTLDNVLNDDDYSPVTIPSNSTYTQAKIKVEDKTNSSRFGLSPVFTVGSANVVVLANPYFTDASDWNITGQTKIIKWDPKAFSNGAGNVDIWMCKAGVNTFSTTNGDCINSYLGVPNAGERQIGLPGNITTGYWRVYIKNSLVGNYNGAGFTPQVRLVGGNTNVPNGFSDVLIEGVSGTADNTWYAGTKKNISWRRNGTMPSINLRICSVGASSCPSYLLYNSAQTNGVNDVTLPDNIALAPGAYFLKVENYANTNQSAVSANFTVGAAPSVLASPYLTNTNDWNITGQTKTLKWGALAFNSGTGNVDIWMCKDEAGFSATNGNCLNSYSGVPNAGEKQIGLPSNITTGYWRVYVKGSRGDNSRAGFTPKIKLVSDSVATVYGSLRAASNQPSVGQVRIGATSGNGWTSDYTYPQMNDTVCPGGNCIVSLKTTNSAYRFVANSGPQTCTGDANTGVRVCTFPRTTDNISVIGTWELIPINPPPEATGPTWTAVGSCSLPCGSGTQTWTCAGTACPRAREVRSCNTQSCPLSVAPSMSINGYDQNQVYVDLNTRDDGYNILIKNSIVGCYVMRNGNIIELLSGGDIAVSGYRDDPNYPLTPYFPKLWKIPGTTRVLGTAEDTITLRCPSDYGDKTMYVRVKPAIVDADFKMELRGNDRKPHATWKAVPRGYSSGRQGSCSVVFSQVGATTDGATYSKPNQTKTGGMVGDQEVSTKGALCPVNNWRTQYCRIRATLSCELNGLTTSAVKDAENTY